MEDNKVVENDISIKKKKQNLKRGRVFIRNLPFTVNEEKLRDLFKKYGEITEVNFILIQINLPKKEDKETLKGYGFIQFSTRRDALSSIKVRKIYNQELNNTLYENRKLDVSLAKPKEEYQQEKQEEEKTRQIETPKKNKFFEGKTVFVKNLNFNTDEDSLKEFFEKFGKVISAKVILNISLDS